MEVVSKQQVSREADLQRHTLLLVDHIQEQAEIVARL
jgi:hypothetical protein